MRTVQHTILIILGDMFVADHSHQHTYASEMKVVNIQALRKRISEILHSKRNLPQSPNIVPHTSQIIL
jgi:hypothetical protein